MNDRQYKKGLKKVQWKNVKFEWNKNHSEMLKGLGLGKELNKTFADIVLRYSSQYTPFSLTDYDGKFHMAQLVYTTADKEMGKIVYNKPYAKIQYAPENYPKVYPNGIRNRTITSHSPKATSHWIEQCWVDDKDRIIRAVNKERKRLSK